MAVTTPPLPNAFRAEYPHDLLRTQERAVGLILKQFADIAQTVLCHKPDTTEFGTGRDVIRPYNVFSIDGARGAGKTYTLLSLENALQGLSDFCLYEGKAASDEAKRWQDFLRQHIGPDTLGALINLQRASSHAGLAQSLNIIFPGDMEGRESLMEAIFAAMMKQLEETPRARKNSTSDGDQDRARQATDLRDTLRIKVAQGWYFSKNFGHDSIVRDSMVVLENNNEYLTPLSAEGLLLLHALLSSRPEVVFGSRLWAGPGEPGSAAMQSVHPFAW